MSVSTGYILFFKALVIGVVVCAPVGPVGILSMWRIIAQGRAVGVVSLLGASTADAVYCLSAGMGVQSFSDFLNSHQMLFQLAGGMALLIIGATIFLVRPRQAPYRSLSAGLPAAFGSTFLMSMANPSYFVVFIFILSVLGIKDPHEGYGPTMALTAGICCGSVFWPLFIAAATKRFRIEVLRNVRTAVNRVSGGVLAGLGALGVLLSLSR